MWTRKAANIVILTDIILFWLEKDHKSCRPPQAVRGLTSKKSCGSSLKVDVRAPDPSLKSKSRCTVDFSSSFFLSAKALCKHVCSSSRPPPSCVHVEVALSPGKLCFSKNWTKRASVLTRCWVSKLVCYVYFYNSLVQCREISDGFSSAWCHLVNICQAPDVG